MYIVQARYSPCREMIVVLERREDTYIGALTVLS